MSLISKIPGFRTGKRWKKIIASSFYLIFGLSILTAIFSPSASPTLALEELQPTRLSQQYIKGKASQNNKVLLLQNGQVLAEMETDNDGRFSFKVENEQEGEHLYQVKTCNSEEQERCSVETATITVDKTPPDKPSLKELPNEIISEDFQITGTTEPNNKVVIHIGDSKYETKADDNGNFSHTNQSPSNGDYKISVVSYDAAGNKSEIIETSLVVNIEKDEIFTVTRVIDGDTIELNDGRKVRYIGIDAPESSSECYAEQATNKNAELVKGKEIRLEKDVSENDRYGRLLRYVYQDDVFINEELVREGYAKASSYPPDIKHQEKLNLAEEEAREEEVGLWGETCKTKAVIVPTPKAKPTSEPILGTTSSPRPIQPVQPIQPTQPQYDCNCSKTCTQMSSCDEAYYQLNTCGCSRRDGDSDGIPCENICPGG